MNARHWARASGDLRVAYVIWPEGMERKFGNRQYSVVQVRRKSLAAAQGKRVRYPEVTVQLSGQDGSIFSIIGAVSGALRRAEVPPGELKEFAAEVMGTDSYDHALQAVMRWVSVS